MTLSEALANVDIQLIPGRVYNFEAGGCRIELRVRDGDKKSQPIDLESDPMLNAWVEFPRPPGVTVENVEAIPAPPFDVPFIPADDESE